MTGEANAGAGRSFGVGDHSPVFSSPDCDGGTFDLYSHVTGRPTVMVFACEKSLPEIAKIIPEGSVLESEKVQVVTFVPGPLEHVKKVRDAAGWPYRTVLDPGREITTGFQQLSGIQPPAVYVLDCNQRIAGMVSISEIGENLPQWIKHQTQRAAHEHSDEVLNGVAPVLVVPRVLEPQECRWLIDLWRSGEKSDGKVALGASAATVDGVVKTFKRREDYVVNDVETEQKIINMVMPRMAPEVMKIFHFERWRLEAFRIGCYRATDEGFFNVHRDDYNPSVKHRKFAVTVNLNADEYEGGDLRFPEYGNQLYRPPTGGAIVFSCSMLHEVVPVTSGERFVLLTFLTE